MVKTLTQPELFSKMTTLPSHPPTTSDVTTAIVLHIINLGIVYFNAADSFSHVLGKVPAKSHPLFPCFHTFRA